MADDKPKRFNPAGNEKPLFTAVKGAKGNSESPPPGEDKPLFRAVKGAAGSTDSASETEERPRFRAVSGALNNSDLGQNKEDAPLFRAVSSDSGDFDTERGEEKPFSKVAEFPVFKPAVNNKNAPPKPRQAPPTNHPSQVTQQSTQDSDISPKSGITTLLLCLFLGFYGGHRFYSGHTGLGMLYLFTAGLFFIGWIVDLIKIINGSYRDKDNKLIKL